MPRAPAHRVRRKPPFFHPVPLRTRRDGWTVARQCEFLARLYVTGSVTAAARGVGMARASAYRLREREGAQGLAWAWDSIFVPPGSGRLPPLRVDWRKVTSPTLQCWVGMGLVQPLIHQGRMTAIRQKRDNSALFHLLRRLDAGVAVADREGDEG